MDIADLQSFLTIMETSSISRAAEEHGLTQSALSQKLKRLETHFGLQLFQRTARSLVPLAGARALEPLVRDLVSRFDALPEAISETTATLTGTVRVGCVTGWFQSLLPETMRSIFEKAPQVRLRLHVGDTDMLQNELARGKLDFAILAEPFEFSHNLFYEPIIEENLVLFGRKLPRLKNGQLDASTLLKSPWITLQMPDLLVEKYWFEEFGDKKFPWHKAHVPVVTDHITSIPRIVSGIPGAVAVAPKQIVEKASARGYLELAQTVEHKNSVYLVRREEILSLRRLEIFSTCLKHTVDLLGK
jgi:DNA-binding transcriptional LysR family regulator